MKLKWDISCPTYIEFLPFIYDILDSSLQEDIGKGNQVRNMFLDHYRSTTGPLTRQALSLDNYITIVYQF